MVHDTSALLPRRCLYDLCAFALVVDFQLSLLSPLSLFSLSFSFLVNVLGENDKFIRHEVRLPPQKVKQRVEKENRRLKAINASSGLAGMREIAF